MAAETSRGFTPLRSLLKTAMSNPTSLLIAQHLSSTYNSMHHSNNFLITGTGIAQSLYQRASRWTARVRFPAGARDFSLFQGVQIGSGIYASPIQWVQGALLPGQSSRSVKLTTHLHLVARSRMMGLHLHSPYIFMAWCLIKHRDSFIFCILPSTDIKYIRILTFLYSIAYK
jgi:hypothetical protein